MSAVILAIDIETAGLPEADRHGNADYSTVAVLEFGWESGCEQVLRDGGQFYVRHDPAPKISPKAQAVNGITPDLLATGLPPAEAELRIAQLFAAHKIICGHNLLAFDLPILSEAFGVVPHPEALIFDTMLIWKAYFTGKRLMPGQSLHYFYGQVAEQRSGVIARLEDLCLHFGIDYSRAHRADTDAGMAGEVLRRMNACGMLKRVLGFEWPSQTI